MEGSLGRGGSSRKGNGGGIDNGRDCGNGGSNDGDIDGGIGNSSDQRGDNGNHVDSNSGNDCGIGSDGSKGTSQKICKVYYLLSMHELKLQEAIYYAIQCIEFSNVSFQMFRYMNMIQKYF